MSKLKLSDDYLDRDACHRLLNKLHLTNITMTKDEYYNVYLQSDKWKKRSQEVKEQYGCKCALCGSTDHVITHHISYRYAYAEITRLRTFKTTVEPDQDVIALCSTCHERLHKILPRLEYKIQELDAELWNDPIIKERLELYKRKKYELAATAFLWWLGDNRSKHYAKLITCITRAWDNLKDVNSYRHKYTHSISWLFDVHTGFSDIQKFIKCFRIEQKEKN